MTILLRHGPHDGMKIEVKRMETFLPLVINGTSYLFRGEADEIDGQCYYIYEPLLTPEPADASE